MIIEDNETGAFVVAMTMMEMDVEFGRKFVVVYKKDRNRKKKKKHWTEL